MERKIKRTESNEFDRDMELYTQFVSVQHLAEQFRLDVDQLMERLEKGCSLPVALLVPSDLDIQTVKHYPKRETRYEIYQRVFRGSESDLLKKLRMDNRRRQLDGDPN